LEQQSKEGDMTITMNIHKEICALSKAGGIPLEMDQVLRCSQIAVIKVTEITELIQKTLEDDKEARYLFIHLVILYCHSKYILLAYN
jgi:exosome complex component RRP45